MSSSKERGKIAYIVKGFPRLSEAFIANEVRLLTRMGLNLSVFSIKPGDSLADHADLPAIEYLPPVSSMSATTLWQWLRQNLGVFTSTQLWHLRRPVRYFATLGFAVANARRYRVGRSLKKTFIKEFLFATEIARRMTQQGQHQHIHAHFCHDATTIAWMVSRLTGLPFSFTAHAKDIYQAKLNPGDLLQRKLAATRFVTTCTLANASHLARQSGRPDSIYGIYHGLDIEHFTPPSQPSNKSLLKLLSVGRHVEKKGFLYLLKACRLLRDRGRSYQLEIVGEPGDQTELMRAYIQEHQLQEQVRLLPPLRQKALAKVYQEAHIFVLPCVILDDGDRDGIPNVMAEAMASGLPVVVSAVSGIPELVTHEANGLLVPQRQINELVNAIERLMDNEQLRADLGQYARVTIEANFDAIQTHRALFNVFQETLDAHRVAA